ncbi:DUF2007 domain-containing protein [Bacteroidota bacterium]
MSGKDKIIKVFTGTKVEINLLKARLEEYGINSLIKNDFESSIIAGFGGGTLSTIYLYISEGDKEKAEPIIEEFSKNKF